ncbi:hypothetical protein T265_03740 [Opisthorchis viverrini]|uniref:Reverse transcriptase domain-containing protein n=1 Tax=Opisthorchis viverrini TaxID=6198 RepID=A0A075AHE1_OPIVI|nr:hypothetical protein T265_03740 [Opisthorchis viverrini]KER29724.1 hypothetical protein T265_03740 [Opisthorchis viverrini]
MEFRLTDPVHNVCRKPKKGEVVPFPLNFMIDEIMRRTLESLQNPGVHIASEENLADLEYADDIVLMFEEEEKAQGLTVMPPEGNTRADILPGGPSLDMGSRGGRGRVRTTDPPVRRSTGKPPQLEQTSRDLPSSADKWPHWTKPGSPTKQSTAFSGQPGRNDKQQAVAMTLEQQMFRQHESKDPTGEREKVFAAESFSTLSWPVARANRNWAPGAGCTPSTN